MDIAGLAFDPIDAVNVIWYAVEGDWVNSGLSGASIIPVGGWFATGFKWWRNAKKAADAAEAVAKSVDEAGQVLKGPIADAVPKSLPEQLALGAAREGQGKVIMRNLVDEPRLVANYGPGEWVKMRYVLRGADTQVTVHYFRNLTSSLDVEYKFK